jgi:hypothetical protein
MEATKQPNKHLEQTRDHHHSTFGHTEVNVKAIFAAQGEPSINN